MGDDVIDDVVDTDVFTKYVVDVVEKGVEWVGAEHFFVAGEFGFEEAGVFETVELLAYGVGALVELVFEATEIAGGGGVQEELQEEFEAGLDVIRVSNIIK